MLKSEADYNDFFQDTLKAGHFENDKKSVEIMIRSSRSVLDDLLSFGVEFEREADGTLSYTREGAHSANRILYHQDITGEEITQKLFNAVKKRSNVEILEYTTMLDILNKDNVCCGVIVKDQSGGVSCIRAGVTIWATGGIGGLYPRSTNFRHLTGDAIAIALKHRIELKDANYIQIHPTTLYSTNKEDRCFLISESVRGEGAKLYDKHGNRFVDELLPRDLLTQEILKQMKKDDTEFIWEDLRDLPEGELLYHFPHIVEYCKQAGYDVRRECIPVVPAQHYYMGGIRVNSEGQTSMEQLYAIGETACTGVHGKNRLASNSLLESLVFAKRAAREIAQKASLTHLDESICNEYDLNHYTDFQQIQEMYRGIVLDEIARLNQKQDVKNTEEEA